MIGLIVLKRKIQKKTKKKEKQKRKKKKEKGSFYMIAIVFSRKSESYMM